MERGGKKFRKLIASSMQATAGKNAPSENFEEKSVNITIMAKGWFDICISTPTVRIHKPVPPFLAPKPFLILEKLIADTLPSRTPSP